MKWSMLALLIVLTTLAMLITDAAEADGLRAMRQLGNDALARVGGRAPANGLTCTLVLCLPPLHPDHYVCNLWIEDQCWRYDYVYPVDRCDDRGDPNANCVDEEHLWLCYDWSTGQATWWPWSDPPGWVCYPESCDKEWTETTLAGCH